MVMNHNSLLLLTIWMLVMKKRLYQISIGF